MCVLMILMNRNFITLLWHYSIVFDSIQPLYFKDGFYFSFHFGHVNMLTSQLTQYSLEYHETM